MPHVLELVPNQAAISKPLFADDAAYNQFRESYIEKITPELERLRLARFKSEQESRLRPLH